MLNTYTSTQNRYVVSDFLTSAECDALITAADGFLIRAPVVGAGNGELSGRYGVYVLCVCEYVCVNVCVGVDVGVCVCRVVWWSCVHIRACSYANLPPPQHHLPTHPPQNPPQTPTNSRTSSTCYFAREDVPAVVAKVCRLTGKPPEHVELPQVGRCVRLCVCVCM